MATIDLQQGKRGILATLFSSGARASVLRLLMLDPLRAYYQRQIEAATSLPIRAVQREIDRMVSVGLLYRWVEGNRAYCRVDTEFPLFPELRNMVLKSVNEIDRLRGVVSMDENVRLAFLNEAEQRVLVVISRPAKTRPEIPAPYRLELMTCETFVEALTAAGERLSPYLNEGVDLLGRREDILWRRIEAAGYDVRKRKGVA